MIDLDDLDPVFEQRLRASLLARADLASGVTGPDPALFRTSAPRRVRRRNALLVAAAIALVLAGLAALLRSPDGRRVDVVPATTVPTTAGDVPFVIDRWPEGFGTDVTAEFRDATGDDSIEWRVFGRDGRAEVSASVIPYPLGRPEPGITSGLREVTVDGVAGYTAEIRDRTSLALGPKPGLTISLSSRIDGVGVGELEDLARAFDRSDGTFDPNGLPDGWSEIPDPAWLTRVGWSVGSVRVRHGSVRGEVPAMMNQPQVAIWAYWVAVDDPGAVLEQIDSLWGGDRVQAGDRTVTLLPPSAPPGVDQSTGVFVLDDHHLAMVQGMNVSRDDLLASIASMRQATDDEWALLTREADTEAPDRDAIFVDGVRILGADSVVLARGELNGTRWVVATYEFDPAVTRGIAAGTDLYTGYQIGIREADGTQAWSGGWGSGSGEFSGPSGSRSGTIVTFLAIVPGDVTDVGISHGGRDLDVTTAPIRDGEAQLVVAIEPAIEVGDIAGATVTGTNPDGSAYQYPPPPDPAAGMSFAEAIGAK